MNIFKSGLASKNPELRRPASLIEARKGLHEKYNLMKLQIFKLIIIRSVTYSGRLYFICPSTIPDVGGGTASKNGGTAIKKYPLPILKKFAIGLVLPGRRLYC